MVIHMQHTPWHLQLLPPTARGSEQLGWHCSSMQRGPHAHMQDKGEDQACAGWQSASHLRRLAVMVHNPLHMSGGAPFCSCTSTSHPPHLPDGEPPPPLTSCVAWPTLSLAWPMVSWAEWVICWAVWLILSPAWVMASWALCMAFLALSMVAAGGTVAGNGCVTLVGTCHGVGGGSGAHVQQEERFRLGDNCMLTAADAAAVCMYFSAW
jgi:hypothetical protein